MAVVVGIFESVDDRVRGAHELGEFALREAGGNAGVVNLPCHGCVQTFALEECLHANALARHGAEDRECVGGLA